MEEMDIYKLINIKNIEAANSCLDLFIEFYGNIILRHHYDRVSTQREADAHIILQMFCSKALHFKQMLEGVAYSNEQVRMNRIVDPTLLFTLVRNQYECLCLFELINVIPNTDDKKDFLSLIHQISGLKYRQRFTTLATTQENIEKMQTEANEIKQDIQMVYSSSVFEHLQKSSQEKIRNAIKAKEYQLFFKTDDTIQKLGWKDFANKFGMKKGCIDNLYSYLCLNAHPSYPSIMQFRDAFARDNPEFIHLALFAAQTFIIFLSVFLVDYMRLFPAIKDDFKELNKETQVVLSIFNDTFRENEYKVNF